MKNENKRDGRDLIKKISTVLNNPDASCYFSDDDLLMMIEAMEFYERASKVQYTYILSQKEELTEKKKNDIMRLAANHFSNALIQHIDFTIDDVPDARVVKASAYIGSGKPGTICRK